MPRQTAEQMFLTQGYKKVERPYSNKIGVCFSKETENGVYDIYINEEGSLDTYYALMNNGVHHWGSFQVKDVALKRCIKRYKEELKTFKE